MSREDVELVQRAYDASESQGIEDGRVLALCHARVRGRGSDVVVDVPFAHVIEVRDGKTVAFQMYSRVADARAAVGLSGVA